MCSRFLAGFLAACFVTGGAIAGTQPRDDLDKVLTSALAASKTPAIGVLVIRDGQVTASAVRGVRRADRADPVQIGDQWLIGSTSKSQTVAMIARLVDRGVLSWDTPLSRLLPNLAQNILPDYRTVTLTQLLSHHAGLPENVADLTFFEAFFNDPRPLPQQRLAYIEHALREAAAYVPGTDFGYSNTGFLIAAAIAEHATGLSYEELVRREVFQPLGMTTAGFGATDEGQPSGHNDGKPIGPSNPLMFAPAGNIHMSLPDWSKFCLDQLAGAKGHGRLLSSASYRLMQTAQPHGPTGLDWGIQPTIAGRQGPVLVHGGSDGYWFAYVILFPGTGNGILVADNASPEMGGDATAQGVLAALLPGLAPAKAKSSPKLTVSPKVE
jgi:CubicO group peptidase (beta-lactamase class C family)